MEKAYDLKVLGEKLKEKGLDVAEEGLKVLVSETLDWIVESAPLSKNLVDDVAVVIIPALKPAIMKLIDKVDGQEN